jgi:putative hemolysin
MTRHMPRFALRLAASEADLRAAQRLRHRVFVEEGGARGGAESCAAAGLEADRYDPFCDHLLLYDTLGGGEPVGTTRVMGLAGAVAAGGFATEEEFDIARLRASGRRLMEVGRTCLLPEHRGGAAMHRLWQGLAAIVEARRVEVLIGLASLPGECPEAAREMLACLRRDRLAPEAMRPVSRRPVAMDPAPEAPVDRRAAVLAMPPLLKAYLRLGAWVGEGGYHDPDFRCIDVCVVLEAKGIGARERAIYGGARVA